MTASFLGKAEVGRGIDPVSVVAAHTVRCGLSSSQPICR